VKKEDISKLGQVRDMQNCLSCARSYVGDLIMRAEEFVYKLGLNVMGAAVERLLYEHSWVPTKVDVLWNRSLVAMLTLCLECICNEIRPIGPESI
jgi:hypothetical protein